MGGCGCGQRKVAEEMKAEEPVEKTICSQSRSGFISANRMQYDVMVGLGVGAFSALYSKSFTPSKYSTIIVGVAGFILGTFVSSSSNVGKMVSGMMFDRKCDA